MAGKRCSTGCMQVKPQLMDSVLEALRPHVGPQHLIVSIAAGVRLASLEANLPEGTRVVRPLPAPARPAQRPLQERLCVQKEIAICLDDSCSSTLPSCTAEAAPACPSWVTCSAHACSGAAAKGSAAAWVLRWLWSVNRMACVAVCMRRCA
jgi:hypothetical protein